MKTIIAIISITFCLSAVAQSPASYMLNGKKKYTKKKVNLNSTSTFFTLCDDSKLQKNCLNFVKSGNESFEQTSLNETDYLEIIHSKGIKKLINIKYDNVKNISIPYVEYGKNIVYLIGLGSELSIIEYAPSNTAVANRKSPNLGIDENVEKCKSACIDKYDDCIKNNNIDLGSSSSTPQFEKFQACIISLVGCYGVCRSFARISNISLGKVNAKTIIIK